MPAKGSFQELSEPLMMIDSDDEAECTNKRRASAERNGDYVEKEEDQSLSQIIKDIGAKGWQVKIGRRGAKQSRKGLKVRFAHTSCEPNCDSCEIGTQGPIVNGGDRG